jgi:hypothetical protein
LKILNKTGIIFIVIMFNWLVVPRLLAQESKTNSTSLFFIGAKVNYGYLIPHHTEIWALTNNFYRSAEFSIWKQTNGKKGWQYHYRYPRIGLTYRYTDFGTTKYLGHMNAVYPWMNFPLVSNENFFFDFKIGLGVAYFSKKFDRLENYKNLAIGSNWNAAVNFQLQTRWKINHQTWMNAGFSMFHASNGTIRTPNFGVNEPSLFAGIDIKLNDDDIDYVKPQHITRRKGKVHFRMMASQATKQIERDYENHYRVVVGSADFSIFYNNFNRIYLGCDAIYDESVRVILGRKETRIYSDEEIVKYGIVAGHEWVFSNLSLFGAFGYYVKTIDKSDGLVYNKIGLNYAVFKYLVINLTLKTYYARADYLSVGVGIIL